MNRVSWFALALMLSGTACAGDATFGYPPDNGTAGRYQVQKSFAIPHVLEKSGRIAGGFRLEVDGKTVAQRIGEPRDPDDDGDGMSDEPSTDPARRVGAGQVIEIVELAFQDLRVQGIPVNEEGMK